MQRADVYPTPALSPSAAPARVTTTLYDVLAALQTVVEPEEDDVVVAIVAAWLRSGRLRFPEDVTSAAEGGRELWPLALIGACSR